MEKACILSAVEFDGKGKGLALSEDDLVKKLKDQTLAWVHMDANDSSTKTWLDDNISYLDEIIIDALLEEETRPRIMSHNDGLLIILRGINFNKNANPEDMVSIRIWIDPYRIITTQRRNLKAIKDICGYLEKDQGPKNSADFLVTLISRLYDRMELTVQDIEDKISHIEEIMIEDPQISMRSDILKLRKQSIMIYRYLNPQKDVLQYLRQVNLPWVKKNHIRLLHENYEKLNRFVEELDMIRDRAQIINDELSNTLSEKMNKNLYVLSLIAALFLPLGFFTGLMGINVGGMPGLNYDLAFWVVVIICGASSLLSIIIMRFFKLF